MSDVATVKALLDAAGIHPPDEDLIVLVQTHLRNRQLSEMLFSVEDARYESPALSFNPEPQYSDWW